MLIAAVLDEEREWAPRRTVLIVEDEILIRLWLAEELRAAGFRVIETRNADEALEVLVSEPIDLLLTDVRMPGSMDGLGLAALTRARQPDLKIIVASGTPHPIERLRPADFFLTKPYDLPRLLARIQELLT